MKEKFCEITDFVRTIYGSNYIPLHRPVFEGNEKKYLANCVDSNFVSTVGSQVDDFEREVASFTGASYSIAVVNGTAALQISLQLAGVEPDDEVITQPVTFVAICNAISHAGAKPVFVDVDLDTMGMSPESLNSFLRENAFVSKGRAYNKITGKKFGACCPMHTFGTPCRIEEIVSVCNEFGIPVVEDSAEALGSYISDCHVGNYGLLAALSFNGNKVITTGGGGMILTNNEELADRARHITTTSKVPHPYEFIHDEIGYNFRMPSLNASLGCAQMEKLDKILSIKAEVNSLYFNFFQKTEWKLMTAPIGNTSNYWLNVLIMNSRDERRAFLEYSNSKGVMTRPLWGLMSKQKMFRDCQTDGLTNSKWLEERVVNIPSSVPDGRFQQLK